MTHAVAADAVELLRRVIDAPAALHEPCFHGNEEQYVSECVRTGWVSSVGKFVDRLEDQLADYTGAQYAVATVNGTAALHVALLLAGVQPGDEVMIPAMTFVATANAVVNCGAVPHFVDIEDRTLGMSASVLRARLSEVTRLHDGTCINQRTNRRVAAIVPMHTFGHPCDIHQLCEIAGEFGLPVVEDAAESLGSYVDGRHTGTLGRLGVLSFNGNKVMTTGGGGAILTNDESLAVRAKHLTTTGKRPHRWHYEHDCHAFNYRMPNINAALGCAQLEQMDKFLAAKRRLAAKYRATFQDAAGVQFFDEPPGCRSNFWLNALKFTTPGSTMRDSFLRESNEAGLMTRPCWTPLNRLPMYDQCPASELPVTQRVFESFVNIPSSVKLAESD